MLATGGCRTPGAAEIAVSLGHTIEPPVPSLFTFEIPGPFPAELAGISLESVELSVPGTRLRERGALLLTHAGLSGPAVLRLSAWGARLLHQRDYTFPLHINWTPHLTAEAAAQLFQSCRAKQPSRLIVNTPLARLAARLWERLVLLAAFLAHPLGGPLSLIAAPLDSATCRNRTASHGQEPEPGRVRHPAAGSASPRSTSRPCKAASVRDSFLGENCSTSTASRAEFPGCLDDRLARGAGDGGVRLYVAEHLDLDPDRPNSRSLRHVVMRESLPLSSPKRQRAGALHDLADYRRLRRREASWSAGALYRFGWGAGVTRGLLQ